MIHNYLKHWFSFLFFFIFYKADTNNRLHNLLPHIFHCNSSDAHHIGALMKFNEIGQAINYALHYLRLVCSDSQATSKDIISTIDQLLMIDISQSKAAGVWKQDVKLTRDE